MTRKERLKRKYALIMNAYQDSKIAGQAKHWGWEKLERKLGIIKPSEKRFKKGYELKDYSKNTIAHKRMQLKKTYSMAERGFTPDAIKEYKRKSYKTINRNVKRLIVGNTSVEVFWPAKKTERYDVWRWWSKVNKRGEEQNMPDIIRYDLATNVNRKYNKQFNKNTGEMQANIHEDNNKFGFATVYFMYVNEKTLSQALKIVEPDPTASVQYKYKSPEYRQGLRTSRR